MENKVYGIIYHLSFPNGNYIGQTIQGINKRFKQHLKDTKNGSKLPEQICKTLEYFSKV
jgi:hypothetical protein